jgi:single-stranded-DNA-specific exonuclease
MNSKEAEPSVRAIASQLTSMLREYGYVMVYSFPDVDSLVASSILFAGLRRHNVDVEVVVDPVPPQRVDQPLILVGYSVDMLEDIEVKSKAVAVAKDKPPEGLTKLPLLAHDRSSVAGLVASMLSEIMVVSDLSPYAIAAAYWRGLDTGRKAEFQGIESSLVELLSMEGVVEGSLTLRLFRWFEEPIEVSLEITFDPLIPGLTGSADAVEKLLSSDPRLRRLRGVSVRDASEESLSALATILYDMVKKASLVARRPSEVIGYAYYSPRLLVKDLRELPYLLVVLGELESAGHIVALCISPSQVLGYAHYLYYAHVFYEMTDYINSLASRGRLEPIKVGRLRLVKLNEAPVLLPVEKQAKLLGLLPVDAAATTVGGEGVLASFESLLAVLGGKSLERAIRGNCVRYEPGSLLGVIDEQRCKQM